MSAFLLKSTYERQETIPNIHTYNQISKQIVYFFTSNYTFNLRTKLTNSQHNQFTHLSYPQPTTKINK